jgi:hypothetical protein
MFDTLMDDWSIGVAFIGPCRNCGLTIRKWYTVNHIPNADISIDGKIEPHQCKSFVGRCICKTVNTYDVIDGQIILRKGKEK